MNVPFTYEEINSVAGRYKPATQKPYNNQTFAYWRRALLDRASYVLDFSLPPEWTNDLRGLFVRWLFDVGFLAVFDDPDRGLVFQLCNLYGYDYFYRPTNAVIANPYDKTTKDLVIGKECAVVKLAPDYMGINDILDFYARKLSDLSLSIDMSIINTRFAKILGARNKASAEALKKVLDKINCGEPAVITDIKLLDDRTDKASPFQEFGIEHLRNNYVTDMQLQDMQTILNQFCVDIGIPSLPYEKKERLVTDEAVIKRHESSARSTVWVETINDCFNVVNSLFGTNMSVRLRNDPLEEVSDGIR